MVTPNYGLKAAASAALAQGKAKKDPAALALGASPLAAAAASAAGAGVNPNPLGNVNAPTIANAAKAPGLPAAPQMAPQTASQDARQEAARQAKIQAGSDYFGESAGRYFDSNAPRPKQMRRALGAGLGTLQFEALSQIPQMIQELLAQADPEKLAALHAGEQEQAGDNFDRVRGEALRRQLASGMGESSYGGAVMGGIDAGEAAYNSNFNHMIGQEAAGKADAARSLLLSLITGGNSYNDSIMRDRLQLELTRMQQPSWMDTFAQAAGAGASIYKTASGF
jgi:hypothetical protein